MKAIAPRLNFTEIFHSCFKILKWLKSSLNKWVYYSQEPKITCKKNRQNNCYFQVYDPVSRRSANFTSEAEVRAWLEERYYHLPHKY